MKEEYGSRKGAILNAQQVGWIISMPSPHSPIFLDFYWPL